MSERYDFWLSSGYHLLDRDAGGGLLVTDEFMKAYLARPEIIPPSDACDTERALHASLLADPRQVVSPAQLAAIVDADARENWQLMLAFRDQLARHRTLEAAYLDIVRRNRRFPPIFLNQMVQVILRNILDTCTDVQVLRAAELFFRPQVLTLHQGSLVAADEETVSGMGNKPLSPLVSMLGLPPAAAIDVLNDENGASYWQRSDLFDMALDLTAGREGLAALGEVARRWIAHLLAVEVKIEPLLELQDAKLSWYVGLDAEATQLGDALWKGEELDEPARERVIGLYRVVFVDPAAMLERVRGEPVYLMTAMDAHKVLRLKPQNLVTGLPVLQQEVVS